MKSKKEKSAKMKERLLLIFKKYQESEIKTQYSNIQSGDDVVMVWQRIWDKTEIKYKIIMKTLLASYSLEKFTMTNDPI